MSQPIYLLHVNQADCAVPLGDLFNERCLLHEGRIDAVAHLVAYHGGLMRVAPRDSDHDDSVLEI